MVIRWPMERAAYCKRRRSVSLPRIWPPCPHRPAFLILPLRRLHQFNDDLSLSVLVKGCGNGTPQSGLHALDELREAGELLGHELLGDLVLELQRLFVELGGRLADEDFRRSE